MSLNIEWFGTPAFAFKLSKKALRGVLATESCLTLVAKFRVLY